MTTVAQLEQQLLTAAAHQDLATISTIIKSLTTTDKSSISPSVYDQVVQSIANYNATNDPTLVANTMKTFASSVEQYTDASVLGSALVTVAGKMNFTAAAAIIDHLTATQKADGPLISCLDNTIEIFSYAAGYKVSGADAAVTDFMTHVGANTDAYALATCLNGLSKVGDLTATSAIIDHLTATQKADQKMVQGLDQTIQNLANVVNNSEYTGSGTASADAAVLDFATHVGANTDGYALGDALANISKVGDLTATSAIIDHLTTTQKADQQLVQALDQTIQNLANIVNNSGYIGGGTASVDAAVLDFATHVGANTDGYALGDALVTISRAGDLTATSAIIDHLTTTQKADQQLVQGLDQTIQNLANIVNNSGYIGGGTASVDAAVLDFATRVGANTDGYALGDALVTISRAGDLTATSAIIDHLTTTQKADQQLVQALDQTIQNLANIVNNSGYIGGGTASVDAAVLDFATRVGANTDGYALGDALVTISRAGDLTATSAVIDHLTTTQKTDQQLVQGLDQTIQYLAGAVTHSVDAAGVKAADAAILDFATHVGANTDAYALGSALVTVSNSSDFNATASIIDHLTSAQKSDFNMTQALDQTIQNLAEDAYRDLYDGNSASADAAVLDFMTHVGANTDGYALGNALSAIWWAEPYNYADCDLTATAAIIDHLTSAQKTDMGNSPILGSTLESLSHYLLDAYKHADTNAERAADTAIKDFMTHVGTYTNDVTSIDDAVNASVYVSDIHALSDVLDNISTTQWKALSGIITSLSNGETLKLGTTSADTITATGAHGAAVFGGAGNDKITGTSQNDVLNGGVGADTLTGGAGKDTFVFDNTKNVDQVTDFNAAQGDSIDLHNVLSYNSSSGSDITKFVSLVTSGSNTLVEVSANGTASGWVEVAQLNGVTGLNVSTLFTNHEIIA